ncbi:MAG TPA: P1 family peptidase, partial [Actinomycetota bacterium]|nr:P1 family peptidase [Actinomycetota bacterium]
MITDVEGVQVGHYTDPVARTGCTVVLLPAGTTGAYRITGAAPATRETHVMDPSNLVAQVHAFVLSGGSAFGLAAADGVMQLLAERGVGVAFGGAVVPIVPAAASPKALPPLRTNACTCATRLEG